uniref:Uncharacterized protein n=1 Tax=Lepeophtheirus salmonis TaxID=72036 RepID=A0A0K2UK69_LEPSM
MMDNISEGRERVDTQFKEGSVVPVQLGEDYQVESHRIDESPRQRLLCGYYAH